MIGLDTNILLRFLLGDDPIQSPLAKQLMQLGTSPDGPLFISVAAILEVFWVLRSRYRMQAEDICIAIFSLLNAEGIHVQNEREVFFSLTLFQKGHASFDDALIGQLGIWAGCRKTLTFDKGASRLSAFELAE